MESPYPEPPHHIRTTARRHVIRAVEADPGQPPLAAVDLAVDVLATWYNVADTMEISIKILRDVSDGQLSKIALDAAIVLDMRKHPNAF